MNLRHFVLAMVGVISIFAGGCQSLPPRTELPSFTWPGKLGVDVLSMKTYSKSGGPGCAIELAATNLSDKMIEPRVGVILFDKAGNTLDEAHFVFPPILPGKKAMLTDYARKTSCFPAVRIQSRANGI